MPSTPGRHQWGAHELGVRLVKRAQEFFAVEIYDVEIVARWKEPCPQSYINTGFGEVLEVELVFFPVVFGNFSPCGNRAKTLLLVLNSILFDLVIHNSTRTIYKAEHYSVDVLKC